MEHVAPPSRPCLQTIDSLPAVDLFDASASTSTSRSSSALPANNNVPKREGKDVDVEAPAASSGHGSQIKKVWVRPTFNEIRREVHFPRHPFVTRNKPQEAGNGKGGEGSIGESPTSPSREAQLKMKSNANSEEEDNLPYADPEEIVRWRVANCRILWGPIQDLLGYAPSEIEPTITWWADRTHPDDLPRLQEEISEHCLPNGNRGEAKARLWNGVYRFRKKDGDWVTIGDRMNTVRDEEGYPVYCESYM